ncbi:hypothetical protein BN3589_05250 [Clostridium sp. C105KSO14]|nr:hypothetical protein BN3589_05250 [Clostridium sp. C105KSO14]
MISRPGSFVLEEDHPGCAAVFISEIDPHPVLGGTFLFRLIDYLNTGFIPMSVPAPEEFFLHQFIKRLQIPVRTLDDPIRHGLCGKVQVVTGEFPFLTRKGHAAHILCVHDACHQGWCCHTAFEKGRRLFRTFHGPAFWAAVNIGDLLRHFKPCRHKLQALHRLFCHDFIFGIAVRTVSVRAGQLILNYFRCLKGGKIFLLFAGTFLSFIGRRMDLLHFRLRRIRLCFLLCLVKKVQLRIAIRIFFAGWAKLFPLRKSQTVRKHRVQEFQFLCFFFEDLDLCFLFLIMLPHGFHQGDDILPAHLVQLFLCKKRIHNTASTF